ncbi:ethanolamine-phosphate cytidylyltransferase RNJ42_00736 [Nakaseomyces bracarensis]|uniref:ethanolamine-phosphate cytidylyltransferase n=1 Tax=Nakaseomyces bracarensis TaxID=273131 RepID=UPI003870FFDB
MTIPLWEEKVWIDGCFDFTHHGHAGVFCQARRTISPDVKSGNDMLICGIHNDEDIRINKGCLPVMKERERYEHARSNRWCDVVVEDAPYVTQADVMNKYGCMYVVHGDDITLDKDGNDCYQGMKDCGRYKCVKRTAGVSTSDIIQRILTGSRDHHTRPDEIVTLDELTRYSTARDGYSAGCHVYKNTLETVLVKGNTKKREVVVVDGNFDLFHIGHISKIKTLRDKYGDYELLVNIRDDHEDIMTLKEKALSILSCKYIDGIIIELDAARAQNSGRDYTVINIDDVSGDFDYLTKQVIIDRITSQRDEYIIRNKRKGFT